MLALEKFHQHLNNSSTIDRFDVWKHYRERVGLFIVEQLKMFSHSPSVYIAGAGRCDDVDLCLLKENADTIVLSDIDVQGMLDGVRRQCVEPLVLRQEDYLEINKLQVMEELEKIIMQNHSILEFEGYLNHIALLMKKNEKEDIQGDNTLDSPFDVVISMPVHTQLFFPMVNQLLSQGYHMGRLTKEDFEIRQRAVLNIMPTILDQYNLQLLKKLKKHGILIAFSDLMEDRENGFYMDLFRRGEDFDLIMADYVKAHGMGLGNYGLHQLGMTCREVGSQWFEWPFETDRSMIVKGIVFRKPKAVS